MTSSQTLYHSYLLRLWLASDQGQPVWRASLENPQTGERLGFASLERLFTFLQDQTAGVAGEGRQGGGQRPPAEPGGADER
jgi:hypothetical protein